MVGFPNVPFVPGVPPLPRVPGFVGVVVDLLVQDALAILGFGFEQEWGLFLDGAPAVTAESVVSFEFKKSFSISDYPVEEGSFESYNKVQRPFDVRLRFSTGGSTADRQDLLESVDEICDSLDLFDAVTPEATYENLNPVSYSYRRTASSGLGLLVVDVFCEQVRVSASSSFTSTASGQTTQTQGLTTADTKTEISVRPLSNTRSINAAPQINGGLVQPLAASAAAQTAINSTLSKLSLPF
jgi:hypothetical protein